MAIGLSEFKCASRFLSRSDILLIDRGRLIPRPVFRRGNLDPGAAHIVPLFAPEEMVVGRFLCSPRPFMPRLLRVW